MRRTVVAISVLAAACGVATLLCIGIGLSLMERSRLFGPEGANLSQTEVDRAQVLARTGYTLVTVAEPLVGGVLVAVVAILGLLAFRWELRRAAPSAAAR